MDATRPAPSGPSAPAEASDVARSTLRFRFDDPEMYRRLWVTVCRACPAWLEREREDLAQRAMMRLIEKVRRTGQDEGFCATYIYRTAHNIVIDEVRKRRREVLVEDTEQTGPAARGSERASPAQQLRDRRLAKAIHVCLAKMSADRRIAISLKLQGYSAQEIAQHLAWKVKRVENMTSRGRSDLRLCLENKGFTGRCQD